MAYANGSCQGGKPSVGGSSTVAGLTVLGQDLPVDQVINQVKTLIQATTIDPTHPDAHGRQPGPQPAAVGPDQVGGRRQHGAHRRAGRHQQRRQERVGRSRDPVAGRPWREIKVVPGTQVKTGDSITQQALNVVVTIAGQKVVEAVIGEAKASSAGVDCRPPSPTRTTADREPTLQCSTRKLVLVDVLERGNRVRLNGVADPSLAGKTVAIVFDATGKTVARAKVGQGRQLRHHRAAAARAPARHERRALHGDAGQGGVDQPQAAPAHDHPVDDSQQRPGDHHRPRAAAAGQAAAGDHAQASRVVQRARRSSRGSSRARTGRFRITVNAPSRVGTAVYRLTTRVRGSASRARVCSRPSRCRAPSTSTAADGPRSSLGSARAQRRPDLDLGPHPGDDVVGELGRRRVPAEVRRPHAGRRSPRAPTRRSRARRGRRRLCAALAPRSAGRRRRRGSSPSGWRCPCPAAPVRCRAAPRPSRPSSVVVVEGQQDRLGAGDRAEHRHHEVARGSRRRG